jgi:hypothetical protein
MALSWRALFAASVVYAYFFTTRRSAVGFLSSFLAAWIVQFFCYAVWRVILYPRFFSPFRHLPQPSGNSFFMGQWRKIVDEPSGSPMLEW